MATYYISPSGNDTTGTGTSALPWLTISKAHTSAANGDTIILKTSTTTYDFSGLASGSVLSTTKTLTVQGESAPALTAYDPPTKAELDTAQAAIIAAIPSASAAASAVMAYVLESGKSFQVAMLDIWAVIVGDSVADNADDPTSITYDSPDSSVQITHTLTSTTRAVT